MLRGRWTLAAILGLPFGAGSCEPTHQPPTFAMRDSAGIVITESMEPVWPVGAGWQIADAPEVVIGLVEGDERYLLSQVISARRSRDGRIAVLDAGSSRVRVYAPSGQHLVDVGGPGDGPSELRNPHYLGILGDTLLVYEDSPETLTWFTLDGDFIRTQAAPRAPDGRSLYGTFLGVIGGNTGVAVAYPPGRPTRELGPKVQDFSLWLLDLGGSQADSVGRFQSEEFVLDDWQGRARQRKVLFGPELRMATSDDFIFVGRSDAYSITALDFRGAPQRIIRRSLSPRAVSDGDIDRYVDQIGAAQNLSEEYFPAARAQMREFPIAETMPGA